MSEKFQIGDVIKVVGSIGDWLFELDYYAELTVVAEDSTWPEWVDPDALEISIQAVKDYPDDFELVRRPGVTLASETVPDTLFGASWSIGKDGTLDIYDANGVKRVSCFGSPKLDLTGGEIQPVVNINITSDSSSAEVIDKVSSLIKQTSIADEVAGRSGDSLGVYRPNLEDRKVGKVGMHMVIDGFPNALKEVAKVMDWAAVVKGYKLHDWRNLPNANIAFPSAEYRHLTENSIQKACGLVPLARVDHESGLLHAAHKVFNGLAEMELILTGKITE